MSIEIKISGKHNILTVFTEKDGKPFAYNILPNADLTAQPSKVVEAAQLHHTPEIKTAYQAHLDSKKPVDLTDAQIINQGIDAISNIVEAAYTTKNWKASEYSAKKIEAEYILSLAVGEVPKPQQCRLLTVEAAEKGIDIDELATIVMTKVKAYEAMVIGERKTETLLKTAVEAAATQADKLAAMAAIIEGFKAEIEASA